MVKELESRKNDLVDQLKTLNQKETELKNLSDTDFKRKREIERELVEIMDRLTQLSFLLK